MLILSDYSGLVVLAEYVDAKKELLLFTLLVLIVSCFRMIGLYVPER